MKSSAFKDDVLRKDLANANQQSQSESASATLKPPALQLQSSDPTQTGEKESNMRSTPHTMKDLKTWKGDMVRTMLADMGYTKPENYFKEMVTIDFLGKKAKNIRPEFAKKLKAVEKKLCEQLSKSDPALSDPATLGAHFGIDEAFSTMRALKPEKPEYQSMHLFGLAIDINVKKNPWITQTKKKRKPLKKVIKRMDRLFNTNFHDSYRYKNADKQVKSMSELEAIYDSYSNIDKSFEKYFALLDKDEWIMDAKAKSDDIEWREMSLRSAKKIIKEDRRVMAKQWSRKKAAGELKNRGIMDLDKRFVMAMGGEGLDWGGKYGDMMHFDARFTKFGSLVQKAKEAKKVRKMKREIKLLRNYAQENGLVYP